MKVKMTRFIIILFLTNYGLVLGQETKADDTKLKVFLSFDGTSSFLKNDTKYFGLNFGVKAKCKYKIGFGYSWLRGNYKTDAFPVNPEVYPEAMLETRTDAKFYSLFFEPIVFSQNKINISFPLHLGVVDLISDYRSGTFSYENYHNSTPLFGDVSANFDFRVLGFMKIGLSLGYRFVATDLDVASDALNTPLVGLSLKIGGLCK